MRGTYKGAESNCAAVQQTHKLYMVSLRPSEAAGQVELAGEHTCSAPSNTRPTQKALVNTAEVCLAVLLFLGAMTTQIKTGLSRLLFELTVL